MEAKVGFSEEIDDRVSGKSDKFLIICLFFGGLYFRYNLRFIPVYRLRIDMLKTQISK